MPHSTTCGISCRVKKSTIATAEKKANLKYVKAYKELVEHHNSKAFRDANPHLSDEQIEQLNQDVRNIFYAHGLIVKPKLIIKK